MVNDINKHRLLFICPVLSAVFSWWITPGRTAWNTPVSSWSRSPACCLEWPPSWGWTSTVRPQTRTPWSWCWSTCGSTTRLIISPKVYVRKHDPPSHHYLDSYLPLLRCCHSFCGVSLLTKAPLSHETCNTSAFSHISCLAVLH